MEERERIKQELLEELKEKYQLVPIKSKQFSVADIFEEYDDEICKKMHIENNYSNRQSIEQSIRKVVAMHFGVSKIKDLDAEKRNEYRIELDRFIKKYILFDKICPFED